MDVHTDLKFCYESDIPPPPPMSDILQNNIQYIAGWICRCVVNKFDCEACDNAVYRPVLDLSFDDSSAHLILLRDQGGLCAASADLIRVCTSCETVFRQLNPTDAMFFTYRTRVLTLLGDNLENLFRCDDL